MDQDREVKFALNIWKKVFHLFLLLLIYLDPGPGKYPVPSDFNNKKLQKLNYSQQFIRSNKKQNLDKSKNSEEQPNLNAK